MQIILKADVLTKRKNNFFNSVKKPKRTTDNDLEASETSTNRHDALTFFQVSLILKRKLRPLARKMF